MRIIALAGILFLCILVIACSPDPEVAGSDETPEEAVAEGAAEEEIVEEGDIVEGEHVDVRVRDDEEPVTTQDPYDMIAQAQAAKESGENVNIHIG
ncbi:hypothetical protein GF345_04590 [Candidatus Woesearchaeota archaeon]|nr:hypothetical protein [Candidatus Woesearchaeota archaeon]